MGKVVVVMSAVLLAGCAAAPERNDSAAIAGASQATFQSASQPAVPSRAEATIVSPANSAAHPAGRQADTPNQDPPASAPRQVSVEQSPKPMPVVSNPPRVQRGKGKAPVATPPTLAASPADAKPEIERVVAAADPRPLFRPVVNLSILRYSVPVGSVSGSEAFWKRVDEQAVDAVTYDVLFKNGLRVGRAPLVDLNHLMNLMEKDGMPRPHPMTYAASASKVFEVPLREVGEQIIYHFDRRSEMAMRSYDASENVLCVEFEPARRKPGDVRVSLCPMVRTLRKRLTITDDRDVAFISPEKFYQLNLRADIPLDGVLIIAPSPEAMSKMSLGNNFLMSPGAAGIMEDVLLLVPQAVPRRNGAGGAEMFPPPEEGGRRESEQ